MKAIDRLALTEEQQKVLEEYINVSAKACDCGLYFVQVLGYGVFAYNAKEVNCFDAPEYAAYDNEVEEIDVTDLQYCNSLLIREVVADTKCRVAMYEENETNKL